LLTATSLANTRTPADEGSGTLRGLVREHSAWVASNSSRQAANYRAFAEERAAALGATLEALLGREQEGIESDPEARRRARRWPQRDRRDGVGCYNRCRPPPPPPPHLAFARPPAAPALDVPPRWPSDPHGASLTPRRRWREERQLLAEAAAASSPITPAPGEATLAAAGALDPAATEALLEEEVREAVLGTAGTAAAAVAFGLVATAVLPTALEDLMALALAAGAAYVAVLGLPLRRAEAKRKLEALASAFAEVGAAGCPPGGWLAGHACLPAY
jgi:hypothetical protein